jgi:TM2 domain-containing membrane protein YozV
MNAKQRYKVKQIEFKIQSYINKREVLIQMAKSLAVTILLAVVIAGLGHIYLGYKKRGIVILIARIAIWLSVALLVPFPLSIVLGVVLGGGFWLWQLIDVVKLFNKRKSNLDEPINQKA